MKVLIFLLLAASVQAASFGVSPDELNFLSNETIKQINILSNQDMKFKISSDLPLEFSRDQGRINGMTRIIVKRTSMKSFSGKVSIESLSSSNGISISPTIELKTTAQGKKNHVLAGCIVIASFGALYFAYRKKTHR